jgi:acyl-CoA synthetase (NDP forming)
MPLPKGNRVGVVTLGGGWGVITADECEERGLTLPPLPAEVFAKLDAMLPPFWSRGNPVDLVGQPSMELFLESMNSMVSSDAYDAVILLGMVGAGKFVLRIHESAARMGILFIR